MDNMPENTELQNVAIHLSYYEIQKMLEEDQSLKSLVSGFLDPAAFNNDASEDQYPEVLDELTENNTFLTHTDTEHGLDDSERIYLAGVFCRKAAEANFFWDNLNTAEFTFGKRKITLTQGDVTRVMGATQESLDELNQSLEGVRPPEKEHEYFIGVMIAALQNYRVPENSPLAVYGGSFQKDVDAAKETAFGLLPEEIERYEEIAFERAEEIEQSDTSSEDLEGVVNPEDIDALNAEDFYFQSKDFVRQVEITEEQYGEEREKLKPGAFVKDPTYEVTNEMGVVTDDGVIYFSAEEETAFGWRKKSGWSDSSFKKNEEELIYNNPAEKGSRAPNLVVKDVYRQKLTPEMFRSHVVNRYCVEAVGREEIERELNAEKQGLLAGIFGNGDPRKAFTCLLNQEDLKRGVYHFDANRAKPFIDVLGDEKRGELIDSIMTAMPVTDLAAISLNCMLMTHMDVEDNYSASAVMDQYFDSHEDTDYENMPPLTDSQKDDYAASLLTMREVRASRTVWWCITHPIQNIRELYHISAAKRIAEKLGIQPETYDLNTGKQALADRREARRNPAPQEPHEEAQKNAEVEQEKVQEVQPESEKQIEQPEQKQPESGKQVGQVAEGVIDPEPLDLDEEVNNHKEPENDLRKDEPVKEQEKVSEP